jgi:hypothetical protein
VLSLESGVVFYKKPFITAGVFFFLGISSISGGILMNNSTGDMDYFALVAFGVFFIIISIVVFAVYGSMENKFKAVINNQKLLDFTLSEELFSQTAEQTGAEIISTNKGLLMIMLAFCVIFGFLGLLVFDDGIVFFIIFACLGVFLTIAAFVITKYRTAKLKKGSRRVILAKKAAFVAGEFHNWDMPGTALIAVKYVPRVVESYKIGYLEIKYGAITIPGPSEYTFIVPIPYEMEAQAPQIISILLER